MKMYLENLIINFKELSLKSLFIIIVGISSTMVLNLIFLIYCAFYIDEFVNSWEVMIGCFLIGLIFTLLSLFVCYKYILSYGVNLLYPYLTPLVQKACNYIIKYHQSQKNIKNNLLNGFINERNLFYKTYKTKTPWIFKRIILFLIYRIPFLNILKNIELNKISTNDEENTNQVFYSKVDLYVKNNLLKECSKKWAVIFLIINIICQSTFIYYI